MSFCSVNSTGARAKQTCIGPLLLAVAQLAPEQLQLFMSMAPDERLLLQAPKSVTASSVLKAFGRQRDSGRFQLASAMAFALLALAAMIRLSCAVGASWQEPLLRGVKADSGSATRSFRI